MKPAMAAEASPGLPRLEIHFRAARDPRTLSAVYVVRATSAEHTALWQEWSQEAFVRGLGTPANKRLTWREDPAGHNTLIGTLGDFPIRIDISYAVIADRTVLFWYPSSQVVDFSMCEAWLRENVPCFSKRHTDANNFHNTLLYLESQPPTDS